MRSPSAVYLLGALLPTTLAATAAKRKPPLLVVGAGALGQRLAAEWTTTTGGHVYGVTRSDKPETRRRLQDLGIEPLAREQLGALPDAPFAYVAFCAPPGGNDDYAAEVETALRHWRGPGDDACGFVFTSSAGVYAEDCGGTVAEDAPLGSTPRSQRLLDAERLVTAAGGTVLRLAGLYLLRRGAHNAYLGMEEVKARPDGLINQVHYQDAASATVAALLRGAEGGVYVAADDAPLSREEICAVALRSPAFRGRAAPRFAPADAHSPGGRGKVLDCRRSREELGWAPRYATFGAFIESGDELEGAS